MRKHDTSLPRGDRGITGLETAIILIAFVVVASVFAFTVLSTGIFSSERSKETVYAGLQEAKSSLEPRGSVIAYRGEETTTNEDTVYKVSLVLSNAIAGEPIDLTPPFTADASGLDPDVDATSEYKTVISYSDSNQFLADVPWTVRFLGANSDDNLLEDGEKAEVTVWLLQEDFGTGEVEVYNSSSTQAYGMTDPATILGTNDQFTLEVKPPTGAVLSIQRTVPPRLDPVMDLK
ncbi:MAG: archaellin/type IV pilin N-terminal domain-containing protein [Dehalococcoidia bacterium]